MSTAVLLIVLALQYQSLWGFFAFLVVLDIVSHWFQMVSEHCDEHTDDRAASFHRRRVCTVRTVARLS